MTKIIAICGKICSGKSYYSTELRKKENAVILSCDELTDVLFPHPLNEIRVTNEITFNKLFFIIFPPHKK